MAFPVFFAKLIFALCRKIKDKHPRKYYIALDRGTLAFDKKTTVF